MTSTPVPDSTTVAFPVKRVYVVDDDAEVRKSLHFLLATSNIESWAFGDGADFIAQIGDLTPAPILLDIRMPDMDGFDVIAQLHALDIFWPVIILSAHGDVPVAVQAMKQGAIEFIEKPYVAEDLELAIADGFATLAAGLESRQRREVARQKMQLLSPREGEVVRELISGAPNKIVAHRLGLSTRTVEMHRARAMAKLNLKSIAEAASLLALATENPRRIWTV